MQSKETISSHCGGLVSRSACHQPEQDSQEQTMPQTFAPPSIVPPVGGYHHGVLAEQFLFVSGQTPERLDGTISSDPEAQLRQVWTNILAVLTAAEMELRHLVHVRTYLASRDFRGVNTAVRSDVLGDHRPALTVVICTLFEPDWVAEIEAIAYRDPQG
jgi:enamine deaminase RidA (YjgF/YER057c/UK114 family)